MMDQMVILKNRELPPDSDYSFLRKTGLAHIENLASRLWTDYNVHDPGITILEALCYAITELGYRTSFDIKDLMADKDGNIQIDQAFFSAKNILTNLPLTIQDYRKLLVDIVGVSNAWLYPYRDVNMNLIGEPDQEVNIYADCKKDQLVYEKTEHTVKLHGLYRVVLDLEESDEFGDLNKGNIPYQFATPELNGVKFEILLKSWNDYNDYDEYEFIRTITIDPSLVSVNAVSIAGDRFKVNINLGSGSNVHAFSFEVAAARTIDPASIIYVQTELNDPLKTAIIRIFSIYQKKLIQIHSILQTVKQVLHSHRNLCEDFIKLETVCTQDVAFCADIEVTPGTDIEKVYAKVLFDIENYLDPEIGFYSLQERLEEGVPADEIFEGPVLQHGFIKSDELEASQLRTKILTSDIINFIMDIEGVLAVKDVLLTKYDSNEKPVLPSQRWCLEIENGCKPVLDIDRSKVLFFKGKLPFKPKMAETLDTLKYLHGLEERNKLKGTEDDLPMPRGNDRELEDYLSVQYEFPTTYGVGNAGLPGNSTHQRRAQAKQLKAYMMFYDQVLGNFFSQLAHAKELFSINDAVNQTYFAQFLDGIKGMGEIFENAGDLKKIFDKPLSIENAAITQTRLNLVEDTDTFYDRRNRFLDHLLARFAESFNEYTLLLYAYTNANSFDKFDNDKLLKDKIDFINDYPVISSERGKAFDYIPGNFNASTKQWESDSNQLWDTYNVSGYERRLARRTGIEDFSRRFLFCLKNIDVQKTDDVIPKYAFSIKDDMGNEVIKSARDYDSQAELNEVVMKIPDAATDVSNYKNTKIAGTAESPPGFSFDIHDESGVPIAKSGLVYDDETPRDIMIDWISDAMKVCPSEGMHLIEHILLRPRFVLPSQLMIKGGEQTPLEDIYKLFEVCLNDHCEFCGEEDPYSFRMSLILPCWHDRSQSMDFRAYFESIARTEAPAHCTIKICWINNTLMRDFEIVYKEWLEALCYYEFDLIHNELNKERLRLASNAMIDIMKNLHSEYPEAQLHDCDTGVTNPVRLGSTVLGS